MIISNCKSHIFKIFYCCFCLEHSPDDKLFRTETQRYVRTLHLSVTVKSKCMKCVLVLKFPPQPVSVNHFPREKNSEGCVAYSQ